MFGRQCLIKRLFRSTTQAILKLSKERVVLIKDCLRGDRLSLGQFGGGFKFQLGNVQSREIFISQELEFPANEMRQIMNNEDLQPIPAERRKVINIKDGNFQSLIDDNGREDGSVLQLNPNHQQGYGFHVYRMPPGHTTTRHVHEGDEDFLILEGEIVDHDGYRYKKGDPVWLEAGTEHNSYTPDGALMAVFFRQDSKNDS